MIKIRLSGIVALCLLALTGIAAAGDDMSSAQLAQFAVDMMGNSNQDAMVSGFDAADSMQIGYSSDSNVTQTIVYDNIGNGSILQWGESGDMSREEWTYFLSGADDSGFMHNWINGNVNQTIYVRNSENISLNQTVGGLNLSNGMGMGEIKVTRRIGGLQAILFPDPDPPPPDEQNNWWFCGKPVNGRGGMPVCAEKLGKKIFEGRATERDYYMLNVLEEDYDVFPPENLTPHVTLTNWNITGVGSNLTIKFRAQNFGMQTYNATLILDLTPKINIINIDGIAEKIQMNGGVMEFRADDNLAEIKLPEEQSIELGRYTIGSTRAVEKVVEVPIERMRIKNLALRMISD